MSAMSEPRGPHETRPTAPASGFRSGSLLESAGAAARRLTSGLPFRGALRRGYHALLAWQAGPGGLTSRLPGGEEFRTTPELRHLSWNPDEYAAFRPHAQEGMHALDIGANIGAYSLLFGRWAGPTGKVLAAEPVPSTHAALRQLVELNGLAGVVQTVQAACSDAPGTALIQAAHTSGSNRLLKPGEALPDAAEVPLVTVDELCARHGLEPSLVKIDVEGFEAAVLRGAAETLKRCRGKLALFVELHPVNWPQLGLDAGHFAAAAAELGWRIERLNGERHPFEPLDGECVRLLPDDPPEGAA